MSVLPLVPVVVLEGDVTRARRALRAHHGHCDQPGPCDRCARYEDRLIAALRRLEAARSQQPERTISVDAAEMRRVERDMGEAA